MEYTVRVLRSAIEIEAIRPIWEQWQDHPNTDLDHYLLVCRLRSHVEYPHVIVVYADNEPCAILASRLENSHISPSLGYFKPFKLPVRSLVVLNHGLLGRINEAIADVILKTLRAEFRIANLDIIELFYQPEDSPLLRLALARTTSAWRDASAAIAVHWGLGIPTNVDGLVNKMTSMHRSALRRYRRALEAAYPGPVHCRSYAAGDDLSLLCSELECIASSTYQRGLGAEFRNDQEHRERFALFAQNGRLRVWVLYADHHPVAYDVGYVYGDTFHFSETGYDPRMHSYRVGTQLFLEMVNDLTKEGVKNFDFGFGDAHYKQRFGDREWKEGTLRLYAPTLKGFAAKNCTWIFDTATRIGRYIIQQLGLMDIPPR